MKELFIFASAVLFFAALQGVFDAPRGSFEWAEQAARRCPEKFATTWVQRDNSGRWFAVCGDDHGIALVEVRP